MQHDTKMLEIIKVLVDVRPKDIYEKAHPEGAKNAALFRKFDLGNMTFSGLLRATALALNGVSPVEPNPQFGESTGFPLCCLCSHCSNLYAVLLTCNCSGSLCLSPCSCGTSSSGRKGQQHHTCM